MELSTKRGQEVWTFPSKATLTFRKCETLDEEIAAKQASIWYKDILTGAAIREDFGLSETSFPEFLEKIGKSIDDTRAYADYLFHVALMDRLVSAAKGWRLDKKPINMSRKLYAHILRDPQIKAEWQKRAYGPLHKVKLAGNV